MLYMEDTADLTELSAVADDAQAVLERAIVLAHASGKGPSAIATETNRTRSQVYTILGRHGVALDSERGRELVAHRWSEHRETTTPAETSELLGWIAGKTPPPAKPEPQLFDAPVDGPAEDPISILEFIDKQRQAARERGLLD